MRFSTALLVALSSGVTAERRQLINRGVPVQSSAFPFVADIRVNGKTHCTGSLVDESESGNEQRYIVTAASCFDEEPELNRIAVHMGAEASQWGSQFTVSKAAIHPMYNKDTKTYDIAILTLDQIPQPSSVIGGAKLEYRTPTVGSNITFVGWGDTERETRIQGSKDIRVAGDTSRTNQVFSVLSYAHDRCRKPMAKLKLDYPQCSAFCTLQRSSGGPCKGDTGGPNLIYSGIEGEWRVSGVTSQFATGCGVRNAINIATSFAGASKWIDCIRSGSDDCSALANDVDCEDMAVSAKTCAELGWKVSDSMPGVCGSSIVDENKCPTASSYRRAFAICRSQGARLCRTLELQRDVAAGTGCQLDKERIWTRTSCGMGKDSLERTTVGGSDSARLQPQCSKVDSFFGVRCCADQNGDDDRADLPLNIRVQAEKSVHSCRDLGWAYPTPGADVCASSLDKQCSLPTTFGAAQNQCAAAGGRLCTARELLTDVAAGTGCNLDMKLVWTSDRCSNSWIVKNGAVATAGARRGVALHRSSCLARSGRRGGLANVRCCADRVAAPAREGFARSATPNGLKDVAGCDQLLGWETGYVMSKDGKTCARSRFGPKNTCLPAGTFYEAQAACKADGAKLCTTAELSADVAAGSGCGFDTQLVWTGDECPKTSRSFDTGMVFGGSSALKVEPMCYPAVKKHFYRCCGSN